MSAWEYVGIAVLAWIAVACFTLAFFGWAAGRR